VGSSHDEVDSFNLLNTSSRNVIMESTQPLTEEYQGSSRGVKGGA
jgi:hypothetical protein